MTEDDKRGRVLGEGKYLRLVERGGWEFVHRYGCSGVAVIVAFTPADRLLLVEQYRPAVDHRVIELPAGLVGDTVALRGTRVAGKLFDARAPRRAKPQLFQEFSQRRTRALDLDVQGAGLTGDEPAQLQAGGQFVDEGPESNTLDGTADLNVPARRLLIPGVVFNCRSAKHEAIIVSSGTAVKMICLRNSWSPVPTPDPMSG